MIKENLFIPELSEIGLQLDDLIVEYRHPNNPPFYYIDERNQPKISADVLSLNEHINQVSYLFPNLNVEPIAEKEIIYKNNKLNWYTTLHNEIYTPTGKISRYPIRIRLCTKGSFHGDVYYLKNGKIGKCKLCHWSDLSIPPGQVLPDRQLVIIRCVTYKNELILKDVIRQSYGERITLYKQN